MGGERCTPPVEPMSASFMLSTSPPRVATVRAAARLVAGQDLDELAQRIFTHLNTSPTVSPRSVATPSLSIS